MKIMTPAVYSVSIFSYVCSAWMLYLAFFVR